MNPQPTPQGTPRTDDAVLDTFHIDAVRNPRVVPVDFARTLERELATSKEFWESSMRAALRDKDAQLSTAQARASAAETALARAEEDIKTCRTELDEADEKHVRLQKSNWATFDKTQKRMEEWAAICDKERVRAEAAESALEAKTLECEKLKAQLNQK